MDTTAREHRRRDDAQKKSDIRAREFVERWEVEQMIAIGVQDGLERYENKVVEPRHKETQGCLEKIDIKLDGLKSAADHQAGGMAMLQWIIGGGGILSGIGIIIAVLHYMRP